MAQFKVGQRVKRADRDLGIIPAGTEGTVMALNVNRYLPGPAHAVAWDGYSCPYGTDPYWHSLASNLIPLLDPDSEWASSALRELVKKAKTQALPLDANQLEDVRAG